NVCACVRRSKADPWKQRRVQSWPTLYVRAVRLPVCLRPWRDGVEIIAMDGFTGFKTAAAEEIPDAVAVMDPFHTVQLAGDGLDRCRQRVQQDTTRHRGRSGDPLYGIRRTLHTGIDLVTEKQWNRIRKVFADDRHVEVEAVWSFYNDSSAGCRVPDPEQRRRGMANVIAPLESAIPEALTELRTLGRTLNRLATDILAFFDHPRTSTGPTEAINGRLEHL